MLATVTDAHMPGDLVQSAGEVLWLSSLFPAVLTLSDAKGIGAFVYSEKGKGLRLERGPFPFQWFLPRAGEWFGGGMASG
ncbi:hypothetical protein TUM17377_35420 [Shewanella chilikensis]|jgi:hypothetical protein|nr:hypothetical protein TUM17377_35420 [Shewanella chilikensis]